MEYFSCGLSRIILKRKQTIYGVPVLGTVDEIKEISEREEIDEIIIAISAAASAMEMRRVVGACEATGLPCKAIPGVGELIEGKVSVRSIRKVQYEDLLGRKQVKLNIKQVGGYLTGKRKGGDCDRNRGSFVNLWDADQGGS